MEQQILKTQNGNKVDQSEQDDVRLMEKEVKEITTNIQVSLRSCSSCMRNV